MENVFFSWSTHCTVFLTQLRIPWQFRSCEKLKSRKITRRVYVKSLNIPVFTKGRKISFAQDSWTGWTPLHAAAEAGHLKVR